MRSRSFVTPGSFVMQVINSYIDLGVYIKKIDFRLQNPLHPLRAFSICLLKSPECL